VPAGGFIGLYSVLFVTPTVGVLRLFTKEGKEPDSHLVSYFYLRIIAFLVVLLIALQTWLRCKTRKTPKYVAAKASPQV
jgi:uncharacterized membrane protein YbhN (UPF0104 family)